MRAQNLFILTPKVHAQQCGGNASECKCIELLLDALVDPLYWFLAHRLLPNMGWKESFFVFFLPFWWQQSSELAEKHLRASLFAQKLVIQFHLIVWRAEIDFIVVFRKGIIKQVSFAWCHFGLLVQCGWDAPLCAAVQGLKEKNGKEIYFEVFLYCKKITQNVDLCPKSAINSNFAILEVLTS